MNLRFDDHRAAAKTTRDFGCFLWGERDFSSRDRHVMTCEDTFGLMLVDFHKVLLGATSAFA